MVEVKYWETASQRKKEEPVGVFKIDITPKEIPEIDARLTGKKKAQALAEREEAVAKALLDCKFAACDKVREIVGSEGVLVANIIEEEEDT